MRITVPAKVTIQSQHPLRFTGSRGELFQIDILNHDLIRVRHYPDGSPRLDRTWLVVDKTGDVPLEGRSRGDLAPFPLPNYSLVETESGLQLETDVLRLAIQTDDFCLTWYDRAGNLLLSDLPKRAYAYDRAGRTVFHYLRRRTDEHYYGFGERSGVLDKHGMRFRMMNLDACGYNAESSDPLYKHIPFYITYIPALNVAYGLFYDNLATTVFDMGKEISAFWGYYRYWMAEDGDVDYTLIFGPTIEAVIEKFTTLTGRPVLLPRWSLGYLGSTMSYTEAPDAQDRLKQFVELCQQHDIPCDMFHLSSGYTTDTAGTRYVFTWNRSRIPDPPGMARHFHAAGMHLAANIKPYLLTTHPYFEEVKTRGGFVRAGDSDDPALSRFWSGAPFESGEGGYIDFTHAAGFNWWKKQVTDQLLRVGIDATWNDNNEYEIWDDAARCAGFGREIPISMARPLQTLLMARASFEATQAYAPDKRPFVLTRAGVPGIQRYAQSWSGDNETSWHTLRYNIPMGLGMGLSGAPNYGHDVGGFFGPAPDPELFVRWIQNGVFHPRFTIHSWNSDGTVNEPWMHPEVLPIVREWIQFRCRLLPYLYTLLFEAHQTGHPIMRPMVYHFPHDKHCHTESFDFMLGPHLLVASVLEPGVQTRQVYLPSGTDWCDFYTGAWHSGGQTIEAAAPLERIPLFVPAGGMIPMGKVMRYAGEQPDDIRQLHVFPRAGRSTFTLIEDDGISPGYQRGEYTEVRLIIEADVEKIRLAAQRGHAGYRLPYETLEFILPPGETRSLVGGKTWIDTDNRQHVNVPLS